MWVDEPFFLYPGIIGLAFLLVMLYAIIDDWLR